MKTTEIVIDLSFSLYERDREILII